MAALTRQYLSYVDEIRSRNLELAAEYLLMAAMLIEIKSRMLLPPKKVAEGEEPEDPRAELVREHMSIVLKKLQGQRFVEFENLFDPTQGTPVLVVTFIALLELAKETLIEITQAEAFAPIYVRLAYTPS
jgi:chromatin segregation and condensation protein Rec8/ScpA/Scc1 (kleisin family)